MTDPEGICTTALILTAAEKGGSCGEESRRKGRTHFSRSTV